MPADLKIKLVDSVRTMRGATIMLSTNNLAAGTADAVAAGMVTLEIDMSDFTGLTTSATSAKSFCLVTPMTEMVSGELRRNAVYR